jgi:branched-chain amino acid transport system permease protein
MFGHILISGLLTGGMYATLALGFSLVFSVGRILNMAHTALYMMAAYFFFFGVKLLQVNALLAFAAAIILAVILGTVVFNLFIDRIKEHHFSVMKYKATQFLGAPTLCEILKDHKKPTGSTGGR